ncbi:MAG TPA: DUF480 domain-containing protein, partial [Thermodesulfovibrionales bacterium]|nr:DUF480 domain-containing protein [Thermodesulfovibrionales bacterium]
LNAVVTACNQKSNRDPVVTLDETTVEKGLDGLQQKGLVRVTYAAGSRVPKYLHTFLDRFDLSAREMAVLCELMIRGPQTTGELRTHAGRISPIESLEAVEIILQTLAGQSPPLVARLEREPGKKERRFMHLLSGIPSEDKGSPASHGERSLTAHTVEDRIAHFEEELRQIREELTTMKNELDKLRSQF